MESKRFIFIYWFYLRSEIFEAKRVEFQKEITWVISKIFMGIYVQFIMFNFKYCVNKWIWSWIYLIFLLDLATSVSAFTENCIRWEKTQCDWLVIKMAYEWKWIILHQFFPKTLQTFFGIFIVRKKFGKFSVLHKKADFWAKGFLWKEWNMKIDSLYLEGTWKKMNLLRSMIYNSFLDLFDNIDDGCNFQVLHNSFTLIGRMIQDPRFLKSSNFLKAFV